MHLYCQLTTLKWVCLWFTMILPPLPPPPFFFLIISLDPMQFTKLLRETPQQLIKFKIFQRTLDEAGQHGDKRLARIKNVNTLPIGVWASWTVYRMSGWILALFVNIMITMPHQSDPIFQSLIMLFIFLNAVALGVMAELPQSDYPTVSLFSFHWTIFDFFLPRPNYNTAFRCNWLYVHVLTGHLLPWNRPQMGWQVGGEWVQVVILIYFWLRCHWYNSLLFIFWDFWSSGVMDGMFLILP